MNQFFTMKGSRSEVMDEINKRVWVDEEITLDKRKSEADDRDNGLALN